MTSAWALLREIERRVRPFHGHALVMVGLGLAIGALDVVVPLIAARAVDMMVEGHPFRDVAWLILLAAPLAWGTHGNVLPWLVLRYDATRYRLPVIRRVALETFGRALLTAASPGDAMVLQPILIEGQAATDRLAGLVVRQVPILLRALAVIGLLCWVAPHFVPVLLGFGVLDVGLTLYGGARCREPFRLRDLAVKRQQRVTASLLARRPESAVSRHAAAVERRVERERDAEVAGADWRLARDALFNLGNLATWLYGAWYVTVGRHPVGDFLFFVAWSSRAGDLFGALVAVQAEFVRGRHALEQLVART